MNEEGPPDLTIIVYKTRICPRHLPEKISRHFNNLRNIGGYFPIVIGNGTIDEKLIKSFTAPVVGTYKIKSKDETAFYDLCNDSFGKNKRIFRRNVERFLENGKNN